MSKAATITNAPYGYASESYSPLLVEQICTMLEKEASRYFCKDYLNVHAGTTAPHDPIDERWRQKCAEWMFKVIDYYDLERDIVNIGMTYLDRMFTETSLHHRWSKLQCRLVAMASLKLAIKLNESRTLNMEDMIKLGVGREMVFSAAALIEMEYDILWKLNWDISPPTAFRFACYIMCLFPPEVKKSTRYILQELIKYMTELAICVYSFVKYKASSKAFACMLVAMQCLDEQDAVSEDAKKVLLERVNCVFGLGEGDKTIRALGKALQDLLHHNTNLNDFIALIRASNCHAIDEDNDSPKSSSVKLFH